jgi:hypothetical protein
MLRCWLDRLLRHRALLGTPTLVLALFGCQPQSALTQTTAEPEPARTDGGRAPQVLSRPWEVPSDRRLLPREAPRFLVVSDSPLASAAAVDVLSQKGKCSYPSPLARADPCAWLTPEHLLVPGAAVGGSVDPHRSPGSRPGADRGVA